MLRKKENSKRQEEKVANKLNGRLQAGSGSQFHSKGDVKTDKYLIECKTTEKFSYSLKYNILKKIYQEAVEIEKTPVLCIEYGKVNQRFYILPETFIDEKLRLGSFTVIKHNNKSVSLEFDFVCKLCNDNYFFIHFSSLNKRYAIFCEPYFLSL